jgi:hypothetical protein
MKLEDIPPYLSGVGFTLTSIDADDTGADDVAGQFLIYGGEAINAVDSDLDLPPLPEVLAGMVSSKISGTARGVLTVAGTFVTITQMRVMTSKPKLAAVLKYISQGIQAILAGRPIPALPAV